MLLNKLMKKRFIILVIVAITFSLVGLLSIQLYWIRNAVTIKKVHFDRNVSEAANRAIYQFNLSELSKHFRNRQSSNPFSDQLYFMLDSLTQVHYDQTFTGATSEPFSLETGTGAFFQELDIQIREQISYGILPGAFDTLNTGSITDSRQPAKGYLPDAAWYQNQDLNRLFFERMRLINDFVDNLFDTRHRHQTFDNLSVASLDSLLTRELNNQGIKTAFEFGIYNPGRNTMVREKTGDYTNKLLLSPYAFRLFSNDVFSNPEYLLLYFPQQERYILSQMHTMLATSIVLLMIIVSSFAFTIFTIFRQKKLSVMKNDFINNMTHELKTPISTISLACQALIDQDVKKSETLYQSYINVINEENDRLGLLTEKVLQTALIEKARIRLNLTGVDIHELIENAIQKIGLQVKAKHGNINTAFNASYSFVKADKVHLSNVFSNLLDNANKYSPHAPEITVITENVSDGVLIHVDDKGVGISRTNQKKIFENLYRVSTGNIHDVKGFGLGLGYVKSIAESHGGKVSLESEPNKGSRFSVFIPFGYNDLKEIEDNNKIKQNKYNGNTQN